MVTYRLAVLKFINHITSITLAQLGSIDSALGDQIRFLTLEDLDKAFLFACDGLRTSCPVLGVGEVVCGKRGKVGRVGHCG